MLIPRGVPVDSNESNNERQARSLPFPGLLAYYRLYLPGALGAKYYCASPENETIACKIQDRTKGYGAHASVPRDALAVVRHSSLLLYRITGISIGDRKRGYDAGRNTSTHVNLCATYSPASPRMGYD